MGQQCIAVPLPAVPRPAHRRAPYALCAAHDVRASSSPASPPRASSSPAPRYRNCTARRQLDSFLGITSGLQSDEAVVAALKKSKQLSGLSGSELKELLKACKKVWAGLGLRALGLWLGLGFKGGLSGCELRELLKACKKVGMRAAVCGGGATASLG